MRLDRVAKWLPLILAATTAVDGWFTLGPLAQSTLVAAAAYRRLKVKVKTAFGFAWTELL